MESTWRLPLEIESLSGLRLTFAAAVVLEQRRRKMWAFASPETAWKVSSDDRAG